MPRRLLSLLLALALSACGRAPDAIEVAAAQTLAVAHALATAQVRTQAAGAPSTTAVPTHTATATGSAPPTATRTPTATPSATLTHTPSATATASATDTPAPPPIPSGTASPLPEPDFVTTVKNVRAQVNNIGWQIDLAVRSGVIDCQQVVDSFAYVSSRRELVVAGELAPALATYQSAHDLFVSRVKDLHNVCFTNLYFATRQPAFVQPIGPQQWSTARLGVDEVGPLLDQAITAAGGTP